LKRLHLNLMRTKAFILLIFTVFTLCSCGSAPAPNTAANETDQPPKNTANIGALTNTANVNTANVSVNIAQPAEDSPTVAIKALAEAAQKKDAAAIKGLFNKKSLAMVTNQAKESGTSLDEALLNQQIVSLAKDATEGRNQKIDGDNATVEIRTAKSNRWQKIYFAKEDGHWKIAMDKFMEEIMRQVEESVKALEKDSAKDDKKTDDEGDK
jgi:hypothetical protein